jgi:hypothetical protein
MRDAEPTPLTRSTVGQASPGYDAGSKINSRNGIPQLTLLRMLLAVVVTDA